ncbi:roadblock/LC7 domain-containing protein [Streptomyces thermolineatus]|uniref:Roadblock/LC7 domain-containing protein n=1 Tax=Streptomyces thermolineatus TaxID=44033 RepID=A0ABN3KQA2_9ACTN
MTDQDRPTGELGWLLDNLVSQVPETRHAIVLSEDGLPVARSSGLQQAGAEHLAAVASGLQSLARGVGKHFDGGGVRQTVIELERLFLFVTDAGRGARLAVIAGENVDAGLIAYEMNMLVTQVGRFLSAAPRNEGA